jgi:hypothetical protein
MNNRMPYRTLILIILLIASMLYVLLIGAACRPNIIPTQHPQLWTPIPYTPSSYNEDTPDATSP